MFGWFNVINIDDDDDTKLLEYSTKDNKVFLVTGEGGMEECVLWRECFLQFVKNVLESHTCGSTAAHIPLKALLSGLCGHLR